MKSNIQVSLSPLPSGEIQSGIEISGFKVTYIESIAVHPFVSVIVIKYQSEVVGCITFGFDRFGSSKKMLGVQLYVVVASFEVGEPPIRDVR